MKKRIPIYSVGSFLLAGALTLSMAACSAAQTPAEDTQVPSAAAHRLRQPHLLRKQHLLRRYPVHFP